MQLRRTEFPGGLVVACSPAFVSNVQELHFPEPFLSSVCHTTGGFNASCRDEIISTKKCYLVTNFSTKRVHLIYCTHQCADRNGELYSLLETASRQLRALKNKHGLEISADPRFVSKIGYSNDGLVSSRLLGLTSYEDAAGDGSEDDSSDYREAMAEIVYVSALFLPLRSTIISYESLEQSIS